MQLTIVLRKEVPDEATGQQLLDFVADKVKQYEGVAVSAQVNSTLLITPEVPG